MKRRKKALLCPHVPGGLQEIMARDASRVCEHSCLSMDFLTRRFLRNLAPQWARRKLMGALLLVRVRKPFPWLSCWPL